MRIRIYVSSLHLLAAMLVSTAACAQTAYSPTSIDWAMYFSATPKDAPQCAMLVVENSRKERALVAAPPVTNPAMSCPDMFSWKLFADAISDGFLHRWATDADVWPGDGKSVMPLPLCTATRTTNCCRPGVKNDVKRCPQFPGATVTPLEAAGKPAPSRRGKVPALTQLNSVSGGPSAVTGQVAASHRAMPSLSPDDPTRKLRQEQAEIVLRNEPMFNYIFQNALYYSEGLSAVFEKNAAEIERNAPYHARNATASLTTLEFPVDAVMIKANFITAKQAKEVGLKDDPDNPVLKARLLPTDGSSQARDHWLIAFHISSKDTPNWVWTTFEYVGNLGRCDFIGCNDSYGFAAPPAPGAIGAANYTRPHTMSDDFASPATIYALNGTYPAETITPALKKILDQLTIGTGPNEVPPRNLASDESWFPTPKDKAWRSYRLKGSQITFTDSAGRASFLGNSVTEAGFVRSSSCITCHARASINKCGEAPLGVFEPESGFQGYLKSSNGIPNSGWYNQNATKPLPLAVQTDFVWGFLNANPATTTKCVP